MNKRIRYINIVSLFFILLLSDVCQAQDTKQARYKQLSDIVYSEHDTLKMDLYLPLEEKGQPFPVLVIMNGFGVNRRSISHQEQWARFAAGWGFAGIVYDAKKGSMNENFAELAVFLTRNQAKYGIDANKLAIYAGSGNVMEGLPIANGNKLVKAAIIYYGFADIRNFRTDLPVLLVRAGLDNVQLNKRIDTLAFRALQSNAPYTIANFSTAEHAFETFEPDEIFFPFMKRSLDFLVSEMHDTVQHRLVEQQEHVMAITELYRSHWKEAKQAYERILLTEPGNNETERLLGDICIELKEYESSIGYYSKSLVHGNWRKGEIARKKLYAFAQMNRIDAAIEEMRILKKIGWFRETDYSSDSIYSKIISSEAYRQLVKNN